MISDLHNLHLTKKKHGKISEEKKFIYGNLTHFILASVD